MNYKLVQDKAKQIWNVLETKTDQIVGAHSEQEKARHQMRNLNMGAGFDGNTPTFMVRKVKS